MRPDTLYHVYNRGINSEVLFKEPRNFNYFLKKMNQYLKPVADLYAYCLMQEHFHWCIKTLNEDQIRGNLKVGNRPGKNSDRLVSWFISNQIASLCKSYALAINKACNRTGGLFEEPFRRIDIDESDLCWLISHIHTNPKRHGLTDNFTSYPYSSYSGLLLEENHILKRELVIPAYGGMHNFISTHQMPVPDDVLVRIAMD